MMYVYIIMTRTQIYLGEDETRALDRLARETGSTRSKLIRDAIRARYLSGRDRSEIEKALRSVAGAWRSRRIDGAAFVERLRAGRLARLHA
jgi:metal-responsive CopG/Arc/MetJ family transcriptional regulator